MKLLLLHGALGDSKQLIPFAQRFVNTYEVFTLNFSGHGNDTSNCDAFSISQFAGDVLNFLDKNNIDKISIFGYSMGGYVAMYLALHHPDRLDKIITLATKYRWNSETAAREAGMLDADKMLQKVPAYARVLEDRHTGIGWRGMLNKTRDMMLAMGNDNPLKEADYGNIFVSALIMLGDRDKMVSLDETLAVYSAMPAAQLCVLPGTPHPIEQVPAETLCNIVQNFLAK